jgi:hypothetical protein
VWGSGGALGGGLRAPAPPGIFGLKHSGQALDTAGAGARLGAPK